MSESPLADWHERAGVRVDPRRVLGDDLDDGKVLFPERLIPYLAHPLVAGLDSTTREQLVARHAYQYFAFTAHFETRVVNRATELIANGRTDVVLGGDVREDAYKIYCDEAYHALYSFDVVRQLEAATGVAALPYTFEPVITELDAVAAVCLPQAGSLPYLLQVVVFETLITSLLAELPNDPDLVGLVRTTVRDHARDEGRHHAYFARFFRELWTGCDPRTRREMATALPRLITQSLRPNQVAVAATLRAAGLTEPQVRDVLADVYAPDLVRRTAREQSAQSVRLFRSAGVLDLPGADEAFAQEGLI
ncbi:diiron oxygenase [Catellatospora aurea]|uniref:Diiron oxygenase n=1 Tax=Catellatospora aurea TaxID=1337874 RepID=A0ABW2H518_9ACTN